MSGRRSQISDSYAVGRFPLGWVEWNDQYRDTVRDFYGAGKVGEQPVTLPLPGRAGTQWTIALDTAVPDGVPPATPPLPAGQSMTVQPLTLLVATAPLPDPG